MSDFDFPLFSATLFPHQHVDGRWYVATREDGIYFVDCNPFDDLYAPIASSYATQAGALAAIDVVKAWDAPTANDLPVLALDALRATPAWALYLPYLQQAEVGVYGDADFDNCDLLPGTLAHYQAIIDGGAIGA